MKNETRNREKGKRITTREVKRETGKDVLTKKKRKREGEKMKN